MRAIGIDIGEDTVKIVELSHSRRSASILAIHEKRLSALGSEHDREIEAIEFVRQVLQTKDIESARVVLGLKQDKVTVRTKQFPFNDRLKILKSLSFEMEEDIPFDPDNCTFDAKFILYEGPSAHVLAVAAPNSHIEKTLSLAKDFGVTPYTLSVDGIAFTNLLEGVDVAIPHYPASSSPLTKHDENDHTTAPSIETEAFQVTPLQKNVKLTLNVGHKKTLICGQLEGRVIFVRTVLWGADQIIFELVKKYQLPYVEAQKVLKTQGQILLNKEGFSFEHVTLSTTIENPIKDLVRDLQMTILEIQSDFQCEITSVELSGGLSQLKNFGAYLTQHLELAVNPVFIGQDIFAHSSFDSLGHTINDVQARFGTAIGLALEAYKKPRNPALQFMRGEFAPDNNKLTQIWSDWHIAIKSLAACLVLVFAWGYFRESFSTTLSDMGSEALKKQAKTVARLPKKQANEKGVKKYITDHKKRAQDYKVLNQIIEMNSALDVLKRISENAPSKSTSQIDLVEVNISDDLIKVSGYAGSPKEVSQMSEKFKLISIDKKVSEETPTLPTLANRVTFSLTFKTDRGLLK